MFANLIGAINQHRPKAIAFDVLFAEADRLSPPRLAPLIQEVDPATAQALRHLPSSEEAMASAMAEAPVVLGEAGSTTPYRRLTQGVAPPARIAWLGDGVAAAAPSFAYGIVVVGLALALWAAGRPLVHYLLSFVHRHTRNPASALAVMMPLVFGGAAASEYFGMHAMFGAFMVGATAAGSPHFREQTRGAMQDFVSVLFAPLFFASIGM